MKNLKKYVSLLLAMIMMLSLIGCGIKTDNPSDTQAASPITEATITTEPTTEPTIEPTNVPEYYPVTITDSNGVDVVIDKEPSRIISIAPNITETLYAIGAGDRLVGRSDYCDYPDEVRSIESIGTITSPDIEKIISLEPDVVFASTHFMDDVEKMLTELGIHVVVLHEEYTVTGVYKMIESLGTVLNLQQKATEVVDKMKASIEETVEIVKDLKAPSVYYLVSYGEYGDYTAGGDTFVGQLITMAGGNNIAADVSGWSFSLERLLEEDPDIILTSDFNTDFVSADNYKELSAVKNGNVYVIDENYIDRQGYRNAEGLRMLAEIFHKEAFVDK